MKTGTRVVDRLGTQGTVVKSEYVYHTGRGDDATILTVRWDDETDDTQYTLEDAAEHLRRIISTRAELIEATKATGFYGRYYRSDMMIFDDPD